MDLHTTLIGTMPLALALLWRLLRRPRPTPQPRGLARMIRDVVTLRMVLRDSEAGQRGELMYAHLDWRAEPAERAGAARRAPRRTSRNPARRSPV